MENENKTKIVETYAEDMARAIEMSQGGEIKKMIHGEEQHEEMKKELSPQSRKNKIFMLLSFLLVFCAASLLSFFILRDKNTTVEPEKQFEPLIFSDKSTFSEIKGMKREEIVQTIVNEIKNTTVKKGEIEGVYLTENKKVVGLRSFINLLQAKFVAGDPMFISDNFLMGVVNNETQDFFILIKTHSNTDIFEPLRAWESKMFADLQGFTGINTTAETKYLLTKEFQDGIIQNKNARVLYDNENKIVLMYIFADEHSVVIADSENAVREIMLRLASNHIKK